MEDGGRKEVMEGYGMGCREERSDGGMLGGKDGERVKKRELRQSLDPK